MITASHITKKFGGEYALNDVSFTLPETGVVGFLGRNGAGKTTLLRILAQIELPTQGTLQILGECANERNTKLKSHIGYLPENSALYPQLTVLEHITLRAELFGLSSQHLFQNLHTVLQECQLKNVLDKKCSQLSKGYRQRVALALALIHNPKILILDEPTEGLDPLQILEFRKLIQRLGENKLVILSSHILGEITELCDMIFLFNKGKIKNHGTLKDFGGSIHSLEKVFLELCA